MLKGREARRGEAGRNDKADLSSFLPSSVSLSRVRHLQDLQVSRYPPRQREPYLLHELPGLWFACTYRVLLLALFSSKLPKLTCLRFSWLHLAFGPAHPNRFQGSDRTKKGAEDRLNDSPCCFLAFLVCIVLYLHNDSSHFISLCSGDRYVPVESRETGQKEER